MAPPGHITQVFVIARAGDHHRYLAVVHCHNRHQNRDRYLNTCRRLVQIFSEKTNRRPFGFELSLAADFCQGQEPPRGAPSARLTPVRFPFITTCLVVGTSIAGPNPRTVHVEGSGMGFYPSTDSQGPTIIDITDLDNVRYCFVSWQLVEVATGIRPPVNKLWSARQYNRHFVRYNPTSNTASAWRDRVLGRLTKLPRVHVSAVADIWPSEVWSMDQSTALLDKRKEGRLRHIGPASLGDQALAKLVHTILTSKQDITLLDVAMCIPHFKTTLTQHLYVVKDDVVKSPAASELLRHAFTEEAFLDWAPFVGLTPETITEALEGPELQYVRGLSICPDWSRTSPSALAQAICAFPHLQDVYVMEDPGRASDGPVGELYVALAAHPHCPTGKIFLSGAASCGLNRRMWLPTEPFPPPPAYPIQQLVVTPYPYLTTHRSEQPPVCCFSLADAFTTPGRFVSGLVRLLARHLSHPGFEGKIYPLEWAWSAAHLFACAAPAPNNARAIEIGPLSAEMTDIFASGETLDLKASFTKIRDLLPGAWTVVVNASQVIQGRYGDVQNFFQCGFVRPKNKAIQAEPKSAMSFGPDDLEVLDLAGFLRATAPDVDLDGVKRQLKWLEDRSKTLITDERLRDHIRFSRTPMGAQSAYEVLQQAFDKLPAVYGD